MVFGYSRAKIPTSILDIHWCLERADSLDLEPSVHNLLVQSTIHCSLLSALLALWLLVVAVGDEGAGPVVPHVTLDEVPVDR